MVNRLPAWLRLLRPIQWTKNAVVLAGLVFSGNAGDPMAVREAVLAFLAFCLVSGAMYVFNDWHDRTEDQLHPTKRLRPIAAGDVTASQAFAAGVAAFLLALALAALVSMSLMMIVLGYAGLMAAYTLWFRGWPFLDILVIALGFVLRAIAGAVAVDVSISIWLFVCTLLLALLLGLGKRRSDVTLRGAGGSSLRPTLAAYGKLRLDRWLLALGAATAGAYVLYALAVPTYGRVVPMLVTAPFVVLAIWRYLYLVIRKNLGGAPERMLFQDRPLLGCIALWGLTVALVLGS